MAGLTIGALELPRTETGRSSRTRWPRLFFFTLLLLKPALLGPATEVAGIGLVIKLIDLIFVLFVLAYVFLNADYFLKHAGWLLTAILFFCASFFLTELLNDGKLFHAIYESLKFVTPLLAFLVLYRETVRDPEGVAKYCYAVLVSMFMLAVIGLFFLPDTYRAGVAFAPAYFSGPHTSAYVISLSTICFYFLFRAGFIGQRQFAFWILASIALLLVAWHVRTALVLFVFFFFLLLWKTRPVIRPWLAGVIYLGAITATFLLLIEVLEFPDFDQLTTYSSGRLSMWLYKLGLFGQSTLDQLLFGRGIGSDLALIDVWWWAAKDSHNDFLHLLTELGIVGLGLALSLIFAFRSVLPRTDFAVTALFIGYISASALSNGLMFRPTPALFFSMALALSTLPRKGEPKGHVIVR